jgi:hypothetical protein
LQTVLIDIDIAIDYPRGSKEAAAILGSLWKNNTAYLSILSVYELYAGMKPAEKDETKEKLKVGRLEGWRVGRKQKTEDRSQKTEGRRAEVRRQKSEDRELEKAEG